MSKLKRSQQHNHSPRPPYPNYTVQALNDMFIQLQTKQQLQLTTTIRNTHTTRSNRVLVSHSQNQSIHDRGGPMVVQSGSMHRGLRENDPNLVILLIFDTLINK
ncbi:hypothetical protein RND81_11G153800 [Saponaria officinalis]|uniref:Uncharacterized protein n=1 Tax=Saponaria officinalis TaxID=3572 RepID=A0AAW1HMH8_SAPOF